MSATPPTLHAPKGAGTPEAAGTPESAGTPKGAGTPEGARRVERSSVTGGRLLLPLLPLVLVLSPWGCEPGEPPQPAADVPAAAPADEGIQVLLAMDRASYAPGDSIHAVVQLSNFLKAPRTLHFADAQRFDLYVLDEDGSERFRWSADQAFAQVVGEEHLAPSESGPRWEALLPAPDQPGTYRLRAVITARDTELEAELPLTVGPPGGGSPQ